MSHKATYWLATIDPKRITAGAFRVLFHLCDHHNDERRPETSCFPSQETLREKTGLSNGGLNKCLTDLEAAGLLTRNRSTVPGSSNRRTYYILGCDMKEPTGQTPDSGDSANSTPVETAGELTPLSEGANSTFEGGKLHSSGEEPVRNLKGNPCVSETATHTRFDDFWKAHPRPKGQEASSEEFSKAVLSGVSPERIIAAAKEYAREQQGNSKQYVAGSDSWLKSRRWTDYPPPPEATTEGRRELANNMLNSPIPSVQEAGRKILEKIGKETA